MAYGKDFRQLAVKKYKNGHTKTSICKDLSISRPTLNRWLNLSDLTPLKLGPKGPMKYKISELEKHVEEHPDMHLHERGKLFGLTESGMSKALKSLNINKKKKFSL